jgi:multicomponent Na+:H+ antiporter subunit G
MSLLFSVVVAGLVVAGAVLMFLAAVGVWRMPDVYTRAQASAKAGTLGIGCLLLALALHLGEAGIAARAVLVMVFLFLTAPVSAHMMARAAYVVGVPLWEGTRVDELRGRYDPVTHALSSQDAPSAVAGESAADLPRADD